MMSITVSKKNNRITIYGHAGNTHDCGIMTGVVEMYRFHYPEYVKFIFDDYTFIKCNMLNAEQKLAFNSLIEFIEFLACDESYKHNIKLKLV